MILFSHYNFKESPVIEFENHDGRFVQLINHISKDTFKPYRCDIRLHMEDPLRCIIEIDKETIASEDVYGLFYSKTILSHRCLNPEHILAEWLAKTKVGWYQPRLGFYKFGAQVEARYRSHSNLVAKYTWDLTKEGWISTSPRTGAQLQYT